MKHLKMTINWTAKEALTTCQCLEELASMLWQAYEKEVVVIITQELQAQSFKENCPENEDFENNDEIPF